MFVGGLDQRDCLRRTGFDAALERFGVTTWNEWIRNALRGADTKGTHLMVPLVLSFTGSMTTPFSMHLAISKTARDITQETNTEASARCIPIVRLKGDKSDADTEKERRGLYIPGQMLKK